MGRKLEFPETLRLKLAAGTRDEIARLKKPGQTELDYIRSAISEKNAREDEIDREVERRIKERQRVRDT